MSIVKPLLVGEKTLFGVFVSFSSAIACWNSSNAKIWNMSLIHHLDAAQIKLSYRKPEMWNVPPRTWLHQHV